MRSINGGVIVAIAVVHNGFGHKLRQKAAQQSGSPQDNCPCLPAAKTLTGIFIASSTPNRGRGLRLQCYLNAFLRTTAIAAVIKIPISFGIVPITDGDPFDKLERIIFILYFDSGICLNTFSYFINLFVFNLIIFLSLIKM